MSRGENKDAKPVTVYHRDLKRFSTESAYRSLCPICDTGVLLVNRDHWTFALINVDRCTFCGQIVIYSDEVIAGEPVVAINIDPDPNSKPN